MLQLGVHREELSVVVDQIGAPTWSRTITTITSEVVSQLLAQDLDEWLRYSGIYHLTASGATSWCGLAQAIFDKSTLEQKPVVNVIPTAAYSQYISNCGGSPAELPAIEPEVVHHVWGDGA